MLKTKFENIMAKKGNAPTKNDKNGFSQIKKAWYCSQNYNKKK